MVLYRIMAALSTALLRKKSKKIRKMPCNRENKGIYYLGYFDSFIFRYTCRRQEGETDYAEQQATQRRHHRPR